MTVAREKKPFQSERISDDGGDSLWSDNRTYPFAMRIQLLTSIWTQNREPVEAYFNHLEDTLKEHDLINHPAEIYNMDKSGMPLDAWPPNVVAK